MAENKGKSGIYRFINKVNNKSYIGSSVSLSRRLIQYYGKRLETYKYISLIYQAILKYGHSKFRLEILEYSDPSVVLKREQYYLDLFKPEYNLRPTAGSPLGYKHTLESRKARSISSLGRKHSEETKAKIKLAGIGRVFTQESRLKLALSRENSKHSEETKQKIKASSQGRVVSTKSSDGCI